MGFTNAFMFTLCALTVGVRGLPQADDNTVFTIQTSEPTILPTDTTPFGTGTPVMPSDFSDVTAIPSLSTPDVSIPSGESATDILTNPSGSGSDTATPTNTLTQSTTVESISTTTLPSGSNTSPTSPGSQSAAPSNAAKAVVFGQPAVGGLGLVTSGVIAGALVVFWV